jgi:excisionase family DNA binding protein
MTSSERLYDPGRVLTGAMHAMELARSRGAQEISPGDLLAGQLLAVARFGIVELGDRALDLTRLDLPFDMPSPDLTVRPHYSAATAEVFTRAARICRGDGGGQLRPLHLLVALSEPAVPPLGRVLQALAVDAAGWRRLLAGIEPPQPTGPSAAFSTASAAARPAALNAAHAGEDLLSPEQVAGELGVHIQTVRGYIRRGKLPAYRLAGERVIRIRRSDLQAFVAQPVEAPDGAPSSG